jgi:hypothetical protein
MLMINFCACKIFDIKNNMKKLVFAGSYQVSYSLMYTDKNKKLENILSGFYNYIQQLNNNIKRSSNY